MRLIRRFKTDKSGATAMVFGLSLLPLMGFVGAAVDYSRAADIHSRLQKSVDAAALVLVRTPLGTLQRDLDRLAGGAFAANFKSDPAVSLDPLTVRRQGKVITVAASGRMQTAITTVIGIDSMNLDASTSVTSGGNRIEIALVLDNTGSMAEAGKMVELKKAIGNLVDSLKLMKAAKDDVRVSVVPFNTQVKHDAGQRDADWLRFDVDLENPNLDRQGLRTAAPSRKDWTGCVADRDQRYDAGSDAPSGMIQTKYPAAVCHYGPMARTQLLTDDLDSVRATANSMQPAGATNITIGLATGLATLRSDHPLGKASAEGADVQKFLVLLTDGQNTQNRWGGTGAEGNSFVPQIDTRLRTACREARSRNVQIFTIKVIEGPTELLKGCASSPSMYKEVKNAGEMAPVFDQILKAITGTRFTS